MIHHDRLRSKYPGILLGDMAFGPGWEELVDGLCRNLQFLVDQGKAKVVATQVKEKFGSLRFYHDTVADMNPWHDLVDALVEGAELRSAHVCERCGENGTVVWDRGWARCECSECREARERT